MLHMAVTNWARRMHSGLAVGPKVVARGLLGPSGTMALKLERFIVTQGFPESVGSKGPASAWRDSIDWRGPLQPVAAILTETWIHRINGMDRMTNQTILFILSILYIDVRQKTKLRPK